MSAERALLHGDPLEELSEKQREWIWRSLLKGIRLKEATRLAQMTPQEVAHALDQVASQYTAYLAQQRALRAPSAALPAAGRRRLWMVPLDLLPHLEQLPSVGPLDGAASSYTCTDEYTSSRGK